MFSTKKKKPTFFLESNAVWLSELSKALGEKYECENTHTYWKSLTRRQNTDAVSTDKSHSDFKDTLEMNLKIIFSSPNSSLISLRPFISRNVIPGPLGCTSWEPQRSLLVSR